MLAGILARLVGYERYKGRGDRFYLAGDYGRALGAYRSARSLLSETDGRLAAVEPLLRECAERTGLADRRSFYSADPASGAEREPFHPGISDLFELAIAGKAEERAALYRGLGAEFEAGYVALVRGEGAEAVRQLQAAARGRPPAFVVELELGRAASLVADFEAAARSLEKAVRFSPADPEALNLLAAVRFERGEFQEALDTLAPLDPLLLNGRAGAEILFVSARALAALGQRQSALERLKEAVGKVSGFHEAYFEGGRLLLSAGDVQGAFSAFRAACAIEPGEVPYNRTLARLVLDHQELEPAEGLAACDRLMVTDDENRWQYLGWIAELYLRKGWRREARDPLEKALELIPAEKSEERRRIERRLAELSGQPG